MKKVLSIIIILCVSASVMAQSTHTVKQGETMESIAKQYNISVGELRKENQSAEMLFPGLLLNIPQTKKAEPKPQEPEQLTLIDRVEMKDGSYVLCKVIGIKQNVITIKQDGIEGTVTIPVKDASLIEYANGNKRTFKK